MEVNSIEIERSSSSVKNNASSSQDFETFLKMLTTQIQNQDPLSPMEADQFASQLASFSMVEQQTLTNQNLQVLSSVLESSRMAGYADIVGRVVLHDGPFTFSGPEVALELGDTRWSDGTYKLSIQDQTGAVVTDIVLSEGQTRVVWDGAAGDGEQLSAGTFLTELRRISDDTPIDVPIYTGDVVEEIRFGENGAEFVLANGSVIQQSDVVKIR
jgi:flagellar basal-body rod modification protein FlgD